MRWKSILPLKFQMHFAVGLTTSFEAVIIIETFKLQRVSGCINQKLDVMKKQLPFLLFFLFGSIYSNKLKLYLRKRFARINLEVTFFLIMYSLTLYRGLIL